MREGEMLKHSYRRSRLMKLTLCMGDYEQARKHMMNELNTMFREYFTSQGITKKTGKTK